MLASSVVAFVVVSTEKVSSPLHGIAGASQVPVTEFGVTVQPDGTMGVATKSGSIEVTAEGENVTVDDQMQTLVSPGRPPQSVAPLQDNPELQMQRTEFVDEILRLEGRTDPVNLLSIDGVLQGLGVSGAFDLLIPVTGKPSINLWVTTPLGQQRQYEVPLNLERSLRSLVRPEEPVEPSILEQHIRQLLEDF